MIKIPYLNSATGILCYKVSNERVNISIMKVVVIGGGSSYTPELVGGFIRYADRFPLQTLCLVDIDSARLELIGNFARRMVEAAGSPFNIELSTNRREAIKNASYVTTQFRVGGMAARREDEYLGKRHGLIGQETTGVGGMAKALRTIPVMLDIATDMRDLAPNALLVNFTNPAGLVTEALSRYAPDIESVGICNAPYNAKMSILNLLNQSSEIEILPSQCELDTLGLNHLTWHRGFKIDGEDVWPRVIELYIADLEASDSPTWDIGTIRSLQMIPNYYLEYYYYTGRKIAAQNQQEKSRAEEVMAIEEALFDQYAEPARTTPPDDLMLRGGAYYSTVAIELLNAHYNDLQETQVVNIRQGDAIPEWPADWVLEMPAVVGKSGITPIPNEPLPLVSYSLLHTIKMYEILTVEAAVHGDRNAAYQALLAHPLAPAADKIETVLNEMLTINRSYLPQFEQSS